MRYKPNCTETKNIKKELDDENDRISWNATVEFGARTNCSLQQCRPFTNPLSLSAGGYSNSNSGSSDKENKPNRQKKRQIRKKKELEKINERDDETDELGESNYS